MIDKGIKVYIERIDITGNYKTRDMVIRQQLKVKEGQLYSATAIRRSERDCDAGWGFSSKSKLYPAWVLHLTKEGSL